MLHRQMSRGGATHQSSMSRAQFFTAVQTYNNLRHPANRLVKQPRVAPQSAKSRSKQAVVTSDGKVRYLDMTAERPALSDEYSYYENTSRHQDQPNDVRFPPVFGPTVKSAGSPRRPVKRGRNVCPGSRKLPKVNRSEGGKMSWYHTDGAINLQALNQLTHRQSFPGASSHGWPSSARSENGRPFPVQFRDDDLTPRMRAERDSLLSTLLGTEDLTEEEINEIANHFFLEEVPPDEEATAFSLPHPQRNSSKSKCPKSTRSNSTRSTSEGELEESAISDRKPKSAHFLQGSSPRSEANGQRPTATPRPHSSPDHTPRRPSDPFHVARSSTDSPDDEVAYLTTFYPPPEISVSPASSIPEPDVHYYDDEGEEVDEEIASQLDSARERKSESQGKSESDDRQSKEAGCNESHETHSTINGTADSSQQKENSQRPESSTSDSNALEELDTSRVNKDSATNVPPKSPRSETSPEQSLRPKGLSDSSDTDEVKNNTRERTNPQSATGQPRGKSSKQMSEKSDGNKQGELDGKRTTKQQPAKEDQSPTQQTKEAGPVSCTIYPPQTPAAEQKSSDDSKKKKQHRSRSSSKSSPSAEPNKGVATAEDNDNTDAKKGDSNRKRKHKSKHRDNRKMPVDPKVESANNDNECTAKKNGNVASDDTPNANSTTTDDRATKEICEDSKKTQPSSHPNDQDNEARDKNEDKDNEQEEEEDLPPIPVISLTRGQLGMVPARPLKHEAASGKESFGDHSATKQSALENGEKDNNGKDGKRRKKSNDERMTIWLTRRAWGRPVDCVDIDE